MANQSIYKAFERMWTHMNNKLANYIYDHVIIKSSTPGSTKKFKLTIDDTGVLTATEITS